MLSINIRPLSDASLFCNQACVLCAFQCSPDDFINVDNRIDGVLEALEPLGLHIVGAENEFTKGLPLRARLITELTLHLMGQCGLHCEPVITFDFTAGSPILCVALPGKNRFLTVQILRSAIKYITALLEAKKSTAKANSSSRLAEYNDLFDEMHSFIKSAGALMKSRPTQDLQRSLAEQVIPWLSLEQGYNEIDRYQIGFGSEQRVMRGSVALSSSYLGVQIAISKSRSVAYLSQLGFTTPKQRVVSTVDDALAAAGKIGLPVVLKGDLGTQGQRVYSDIRDANELFEKFSALTTPKNANQSSALLPIVVEEFISGSVYRMEVIGDRFFDAYEMTPATIIGDGQQTINQLIAEENENPNRGSKENHEGSYVRLSLQKEELATLAKQGLTPQDIPKLGEQIQLRSNSNWSSGGTYKLVTQQVHADNQKLAEAVARALKIDILGIDVITEDITKSHLHESLTIIEVNHAPNVGSYFDTDQQVFIDNARRIIRRLAPEVHYGSVPVLIVKDSYSSAQIESLLSCTLELRGFATGLVNSSGITLSGSLITRSDHIHDKDPSLQLLRNPSVGAAVINKTSEQMADYGVGSGSCDVAILAEIKHENITTPMWPAGLSSQKTDQLLVECARTAAVLYVTTAEGINLCLQNNSEKIFAIFYDDLSESDSLTHGLINWIRLSAEGQSPCRVEYNLIGQNGTFFLDAQQKEDRVARAITFATLVSIGVTIEDAENTLVLAAAV